LSRKVQELEGELAAARRRETATAQILRVISRSRTDIQSVLDTVAEGAARLCEAEAAGIFRRAENKVLLVAHHGPMPFGPVREFSFPLVRGSVNGRSVLDARTIHVADLMSEGSEYPEGSENARRYGHRTVLAVPLLRESIAVGSISLHRAEARLFTEAQVALLQTFADQAVIAIETTRLFEAEQARTRELSEALEQQTATSQVLSIISTSPGELEPVFQTMLQSAVRICEASFGNLYLCEGDGFRFVSIQSAPPAYREWLRQRDPYARWWTIPTGAKTPLARAIRTKQTQQVADARSEPPYIERDPPFVALVDLAGARTLLVVPMLTENEPVGAIAIYRQEVRPFTDKQIELVKSFASQAVIAIENTRLLSELRESLQQQTATSELLKVIGRSTFNLQPVFETLAENAVRVCEAEHAFIFRYDGQLLRSVASHNIPLALRAFVEANPTRPGRESAAGRAASERRTIHIEDIRADPEFTYGVVHVGPMLTVLAIPMLRADELLGVIVITRPEVRLFTHSQIALMETFADQAVIAIVG